MSVTATHPDYDATRCRWDLVRSVIDNKANHWIRTIDPSDAKRSKQYKDDALLTNYTRLTQIGLTGLVFRESPDMLLASGLEYMQLDATGQNFGLEQLSRKIVMEILASGRYGLLVDYVDTAYINAYAPYNIINWQCKRFRSKYKLSLVVLCEEVDSLSDDGFTHECSKQYRVLRLSDDEIYYQEVYDDKYTLVSSIIPVDYNNNTFDEIPFVFVGSENNDPCIDNIPLYDIAVVNIGHYRNSADLEESGFVCGQPMTHIDIGETDMDEFKDHYPDGVKFGSRRAVTTRGGSVSLVQASPNQLIDIMMQRKEAQIVAIGARIISPPGGRETAEAAKIRFASQNSALYTICVNVNLAIEFCLWYAARFMTEIPERSVFELNTEFYDTTTDPSVVIQQILPAVDRGVLSANEARKVFEENGVELEENPILENAQDPYVTPE